MDHELRHYGIKGQKWGVRRYQNKDGSYTTAGNARRKFRSTSVNAAVAKRQNAKIDKSFDKWKTNTKKRENAIELGKKANTARRAYEEDRSNKELKQEYKRANKDYKKALRTNTTYRKGQIRGEVGSDISRKYLSAAKKVEKQLKNDPDNRELQKKYNDLMSKHAVERAKARRAPTVAANRSRRIASVKRATKLALKSAAFAAAVSAGTQAYNNRAMKKGDIPLDATDVMYYANLGRIAMRGARKYI